MARKAKAPAVPQADFAGWSTWDGQFVAQTTEPDWLQADRAQKQANSHLMWSAKTINWEDYAKLEQARLDTLAEHLRAHNIARLYYYRPAPKRSHTDGAGDSEDLQSAWDF